MKTAWSVAKALQLMIFASTPLMPALARPLPSSTDSSRAVSVRPHYPKRIIPNQVLAGANAQLERRVGREFFENYITLDSSTCRYSPGIDVLLERPSRPPDSSACGVQTWLRLRPAVTTRPHWKVEYRFSMPEKPWASGPIEVDVGLDGSRLGPDGILGTGNCAEHPDECKFPIDKEKAFAIARKAGPEERIKRWDAFLQWQIEPYPGFIWRVINTTSILPSRSVLSTGREIVIDASSGSVLCFRRHDLLVEVE